MDEGTTHWWVEDYLDTPTGKVRKIRTELTLQDKLGSYRVRWGIQRYTYTVSPGLYAIGNPNSDSPVVVTANYKLTFDCVRQALRGQNLWVVVLDTKGINVWCAAGKGTFGTHELIARIKKLQLAEIVSHRTVIVPQLGGPGIASHEVKRETGFTVVYGPVQISDLKEFLDQGMQATRAMRQVEFGLKDRLVLTPMEMVPGFKYFAIAFILLFVLNLGGGNLSGILTTTLYNLIPYLGAYLVGSFFVPVLLPYLPARSFAMKGFILGMIWVLLFINLKDSFLVPDHVGVIIGHSLLLLSLVTYLALNFTGSSTYTSLSGTTKETLYAIPLIVLATLIGVGLLLGFKFL